MLKTNDAPAGRMRVDVTELYDKTSDAKERCIINVGGAGSSKSHTLTQFFIFERLLKFYNYKLLVLRKTRHSNKLSAYAKFIELLKQYGLYNDFEDSKTDLIYTFSRSGNQARFAGLDDREKLKSTEWHDAWLEEANEFEKDDLLFVKTRLYRGAVMFNKPRIYLSLNPVECWVHKLEGQPDTNFIYSSYKDNPFANEDTIQILEGLKDEDELYYQIYAQGKWGILKEVIYKPYIMIPLADYPATFDDEIYGLDFGYNAPTALIHLGYKDKARYLRELMYQTKLTNADLIDRLREVIPADKHESATIYADSEAPEKIQEIYNAGFYGILPAVKGPNSVKNGIDFCKRQNYYTCVENENINKERQTYKYKQDKNGDYIDTPVKFNDHALDAKRYAEYTHGLKGDIRIL